MEAIADRSGLHFIVSTDRRKLDTGTRKLIRSHVMKGKNKGKTRHRDCADPKPPTTDRTQHEQDDRGLSIIVNQGHNDVPRNIGSDLAFFPLADDIDYSLVVPIFKYL
ncbi:hypothetical protein VM1G_02891 [Cytospora mali]|uniref:Uncharacterized protein n=1 Tax=Cytospora mali TaxID=578113 RepID=A0A194VSU0_CYTMA|nr:hypothetical protein VM1G_02891 [Valsa mali]